MRFDVHYFVVTSRIILNFKLRLRLLLVRYWLLSLGYILTPSFFLWYGLNAGSVSEMQLAVSYRHGTCLVWLATSELLLAGNNVERFGSKLVTESHGCILKIQQELFSF